MDRLRCYWVLKFLFKKAKEKSGFETSKYSDELFISYTKIVSIEIMSAKSPLPLNVIGNNDENIVTEVISQPINQFPVSSSSTTDLSAPINLPVLQITTTLERTNNVMETKSSKLPKISVSYLPF